MGAFSAGFRHVATAMLVMVSSRCFCERGGELWDVVISGEVACLVSVRASIRSP
jgi:hypothetical protein